MKQLFSLLFLVAACQGAWRLPAFARPVSEMDRLRAAVHFSASAVAQSSESVVTHLSSHGSGRFRQLQNDVPAACRPLFTEYAGSGCAELLTNATSKGADGWATKAEQTLYCDTKGCQTKLQTLVKCWVDNGSGTTAPPDNIQAINVINLCDPSTLKMILVPPPECNALFQGCDANIFTKFQENTKNGLPDFSADIDKLCDNNCFGKISPVLQCMVNKKLLPTLPDLSELNKLSSIVCAKGADGSRCYLKFREYEVSNCVDAPNFDSNPAALDTWVNDKSATGQQAFCEKGCGEIGRKAIVCMAESKVPVPGPNGVMAPINLSKIEAAYVDILCLQADGKNCLPAAKVFKELEGKKLSALTEEDLGKICNPCVRRIMDRFLLAGANLGPSAAYLSVVCLAELSTGKYCLPEVPTELKAAIDSNTSLENTGYPADKQLGLVCANRCTKRFLLSLVSADLVASRESGASPSVIQAKVRARTDMQVFLELFCFQNAKKDYCLTSPTIQAEVDKLIAACPSLKIIGNLSNFGLLNPQAGPASRPAPPSPTAPTLFTQQGQTDINSVAGTCSEPCKAAFKSYISVAGCCYGLGVDRLILTASTDPTIPAEYVTPYVNEFKKVLGLCGTSPDADPATVSCAKPRGKETVEIPITTSADPKLVAKDPAVTEAFRDDLCDQLVMPGALTSNCKISKTETTVINAPAPAAAGRFAAAASNSTAAVPISGTTFTLSFQGTTDEQTAQFKADTTKALATNQLSTTKLNLQVQASSGSAISTVNLDPAQAKAEVQLEEEEEAAASASSSASSFTASLLAALIAGAVALAA